MVHAGIFKCVVYTLALYASVCSCKAQRQRKMPSDMDDALRSLLNGGGGGSRNTYAPRTKKQPKQVEGESQLHLSLIAC